MTAEKSKARGEALIDYAAIWLPGITPDRSPEIFEAAQGAFHAATDAAMPLLRFEDEPQHYFVTLSTSGDPNERSS